MILWWICLFLYLLTVIHYVFFIGKVHGAWLIIWMTQESLLLVLKKTSPCHILCIFEVQQAVKCTGYLPRLFMKQTFSIVYGCMKYCVKRWGHVQHWLPPFQTYTNQFYHNIWVPLFIKLCTCKETSFSFPHDYEWPLTPALFFSQPLIELVACLKSLSSFSTMLETNDPLCILASTQETPAKAI